LPHIDTINDVRITITIANGYQYNTKARSKSKSKKPHNYQLCNEQFRTEIRDLIPSKKESLYFRQIKKWDHKEICVQHEILPTLNKHHLSTNQVSSFDSNKDHYIHYQYHALIQVAIK